jgi:hypothetical protein
MRKSKTPKTTNISNARSLEEIAEFWDTHSLADYWDQTHEVEFEVQAKRRNRTTLEKGTDENCNDQRAR